MDQQKHNVIFVKDMSPDYRSGYLDALRVVDIMEYRARCALFGAMRRAVAEARRIDRGVFYETDANVIDYREAEAALIRRTIRSIMESVKI